MNEGKPEINKEVEVRCRHCHEIVRVMLTPGSKDKLVSEACPLCKEVAYDSKDSQPISF